MMRVSHMDQSIILNDGRIIFFEELEDAFPPPKPRDFGATFTCNRSDVFATVPSHGDCEIVGFESGQAIIEPRSGVRKDCCISTMKRREAMGMSGPIHCAGCGRSIGTFEEPGEKLFSDPVPVDWIGILTWPIRVVMSFLKFRIKPITRPNPHCRCGKHFGAPECVRPDPTPAPPPKRYPTAWDTGRLSSGEKARSVSRMVRSGAWEDRHFD